jgi:hypothetical protein
LVEHGLKCEVAYACADGEKLAKRSVRDQYMYTGFTEKEFLI